MKPLFFFLPFFSLYSPPKHDRMKAIFQRGLHASSLLPFALPGRAERIEGRRLDSCENSVFPFFFFFPSSSASWDIQPGGRRAVGAPSPSFFPSLPPLRPELVKERFRRCGELIAARASSPFPFPSFPFLPPITHYIVMGFVLMWRRATNRRRSYCRRDAGDDPSPFFFFLSSFSPPPFSPRRATWR